MDSVLLDIISTRGWAGGRKVVVRFLEYQPAEVRLDAVSSKGGTPLNCCPVHRALRTSSWLVEGLGAAGRQTWTDRPHVCGALSDCGASITSWELESE